jgi:hypothetical protein
MNTLQAQQSPGYLNKRFAAGMGIKTMATGANANIGYRGYGLNFGFAPEVNYLLTQKTIVTSQLCYVKNWLVFKAININEQIIPDTLVSANYISLNVGLKLFKERIAPVGGYVSIRAGASFVQSQSRELIILTDNYGDNSPSYQFLSSLKTYPQLIVAFGSQRVFFKRLMVDKSIGTDIGTILLFKNKTKATSAFITSNIIYFQLGASWLLF